MNGMRKIPARMRAKLARITTPAVTVGCGRCVPIASLMAGELQNIGVGYGADGISLSATPVVPAASGPFSDRNLNGREIRHDDQPKIQKDIYLGERPNWGDWSNGSFSLWQTRMVYPRSFEPPRGIGISVSDQGKFESGECWRLAFVLAQPLLRAEPEFEEDLLFALNLCREVVGCFDVHPSDVTPAEIVAERKLNWEIFPPGKREFRQELERRLQGTDSDTRTRLLARADVITSLAPTQYAIGSGFNSNYYGAIFDDDLVLFENLDYGNATYVLRDDWQRLSQLSRTELLASDSDFDRLIHDKTWDDRLRQLIAHERELRRRRRR